MDLDMIKLIIGFILGVLGSFLTVYYSFAIAKWIDILLVVVGLVMVVTYCYLTWDWFELNFGEDGRIAIFLVPLMVFGATMVFLSLTSSGIVPPHDKVMALLGAVLIIAPGAFLWFNQRKVQSDTSFQRDSGQETSDQQREGL